jgi:hypothetical protein
MKRLALILATLFATYAQGALALHITPLETLVRPLFKSAPMVRTNSHAAQYAGRTTIGSGSASQVVSTGAVNSDSLIYATVQVALPAAYAVQGIGAIAAGAASFTASTTAVTSGQHISLSPFLSSNQASGHGRGFSVRSIVDGVSFAVATEDGQNVTSGPAAIGWRIPDAIPEGIKVNSIGVGHFLLGWADGKSRPVDAVVMWEIRRAA